MRVLLATTQFMPEIGGVPRLLWKLCQHKPPEHSLSVLGVCQLDPGAYDQFDRSAGLPIERVKQVAGSGLTSLRFFLHMLRAIRRSRIDVILCGVGFPTAILAAVAHLLTRLPYAAITHSEDLTIQGAARRRLLGWALNSAQAVFALGSFGEQQLRSLGVTRPPVFRAPPGIDPEPFLAENPLGQVPKPPGQFTLLTVARLVHRKGQDLVLRALPELRRKIPGVRYIIIGSGPDETALRGLAESLGVADCVTFAGSISDALLPVYYQACDVFVMPTRPSDDRLEVEGFGIVFLEAGAAGKPVIAGCSGGVEGAVLDGLTGYLVDPYSLDELVRRVEQLAAEPQLAQRLGSAGRARVLREFTAEGYSRKIFQGLEQAAAPGKE